MPQRYRVKGKHIYYASVVDTDMGLDDRGERRIVRQMGATRRVEVGEILDDVPAHILAAFPGRFELVPEPAPAPAPSRSEASASPRAPEPPAPDKAPEPPSGRDERRPQQRSER